MSQIKSRIIFSFEDGEPPVVTSDYEFLKKLGIPGDPTYSYIHQIAPGTPLTLPDGKKAEIINITCNYFDMEYKNEGIYVHSHGVRHPYNFEIIIKIRRTR